MGFVGEESLLLLSIVVLLFPLAMYCWFLAALNRRARPTLLSGTLDCAGLGFAASGILLFVGPNILTILFSKGLQFMPIEEEVQHDFMAQMQEWWLLWAGYYAAVIAIVAWLFWSRRNKTVI